MDADLQLQHDHARQQHHVRQQVAGLRHAAIQLECTLPAGRIQAETVRKVIDRLRRDATQLERGL